MKTDSSKRRILIVDDDEHTRTLLRDFCEQSSFTASVAPDGEQIVQKLEQFRPDLVLLDLVLPKKDGFAVLKEIRDQSEWTELPVVILTAVGDMDGKIRGMELGADDFITKPFKLVDLQTRVSSALTIREYRKKLTAAEEALAQLRAVDPVTGAGTYAQLKASVDSEIVRTRSGAACGARTSYSGWTWESSSSSYPRPTSNPHESPQGGWARCSRI